MDEIKGINMALLEKLETIECVMDYCENMYLTLKDLGYRQEAEQIDAVRQSMNLHHHDLFEREGPVIIRKDSR